MVSAVWKMDVGQAEPKEAGMETGEVGEGGRSSLVYGQMAYHEHCDIMGGVLGIGSRGGRWAKSISGMGGKRCLQGGMLKGGTFLLMHGHLRLLAPEATG
jgi:hypothetical protein